MRAMSSCWPPSPPGWGWATWRACSRRCTCGPGGTCPDQDRGREFADREVKLATTIGGAGVMHGDLTAECAAAVAAVLDALSAPAGKEDDRSKGQRYHDALAEAMRRLTAAGLLPERAGQPVKAWAHISLADLLLLDGDSALQEEWTEQVRARWAARRAAASETGASDGAWLDGDAAAAIACDAAMAPIVTGDVNVDALEDLVRLCVELDGRRAAAARTPGFRHHGGLGGARAGRDRQGRGPAVGSGRASVVPARRRSRVSPGQSCRLCSHTVAQVGELVAELPLAQGGLAGKQDPLELAGVQVDQGAFPGAARRAGTHASSMQ